MCPSRTFGPGWKLWGDQLNDSRRRPALLAKESRTRFLAIVRAAPQERLFSFVSEAWSRNPHTSMRRKSSMYEALMNATPMSPGAIVEAVASSTMYS